MCIFKEKHMRLLLFILLLTSLTVSAQTEEDKVKGVVTKLFDGMRKSDSAMIRTAFVPDAIMQTIITNKEGKTEVRNEKLSDFITAVTKPHKDLYDERITFDIIRIDGALAIAWTPYQFYVSNTFSHCGVDSFQLVKINGEWKIQYIIDTRRKEGCL